MIEMRRKLELGCLIIITIAWALFVLWWLFGARILPVLSDILDELYW